MQNCFPIAFLKKKNQFYSVKMLFKMRNIVTFMNLIFEHDRFISLICFRDLNDFNHRITNTKTSILSDKMVMKSWKKMCGYKLRKGHWNTLIFFFSFRKSNSFTGWYNHILPQHGTLCKLILFHVKQKELIWHPFYVRNKRKLLKNKLIVENKTYININLKDEILMQQWFF